jgi:hypothetical protein
VEYSRHFTAHAAPFAMTLFNDVLAALLMTVRVYP